MHNNFAIQTELDYLYYAVDACDGKKCDRDGNWQVAPFYSSIPYRECSLLSLNRLKHRLSPTLPQLLEYGANRANRAYYLGRDSATKPSYSKRLSNIMDTDIDQLEQIGRIDRKEPTSGGLIFRIFHPEDLRKRVRPGYVPCLVS